MSSDEELRKRAAKMVGREVETFKKMCPEGQQPILSVLRIHLLTEYYLERIINLQLPRGDKLLGNTNLTYAQKLGLVEALTVLDDKAVQSLRNLNRIRNRCAHEMNREITLADIDLIARPLRGEHTRLRRNYAAQLPEYLRQVLSALCRGVVGILFGLEELKLTPIDTDDDTEEDEEE
ncbi:hypothetical protein KAX17_15960 [Candidatus Bipolaricaulota bacterium]|nr:hypothetical protein [Candidatus Bipolaricaulota bacterium]